MRKKIILFCSVFAVVISAITVSVNVIGGNTVSRDILLANVNALARGEEITANVTCSGDGGIYCPINQKDEYKEVVWWQD